MDKNNRNRGFTLVELIITVAILAIIVAPFLATFVMSSTNNVNASINQNLADVAEDISEEFKGKSLELLTNSYTNTPDVSGTGYVFNFNDSAIQALGMPAGYTAEVTLTPSATSSINGSMPTITNMSGNNAMSIVSGFYTNDTRVKATYPGTNYYRVCTVHIYYDDTIDTEYPNGKYIMSLDVEYYNNTGHLCTYSNVMSSEFKYEDDVMPPSLYMVYATMGSGDKVKIDNQIEESELPLDDDGVPMCVDVYLAVQDQTDELSVNNLYVKESDAVTERTFVDFIKNKTNKMTNIYTNIDIAGTVIESIYNNSLLKGIESNRIYDIEVKVTKGNKSSTFKSTKINLS